MACVLSTDIVGTSHYTALLEDLQRPKRGPASGDDVPFQRGWVTCRTIDSKGLGKYLNMQGSWVGIPPVEGEREKGKTIAQVSFAMIGPDPYPPSVGLLTQPLVADPLPDQAQSQPDPVEGSSLISADENEKG